MPIDVYKALTRNWIKKTGDTMISGFLTLFQDPVNPLDAATKHYVDAAIAGIPSASPGGANTAVQFNDSGAFGGDATNFSWQKTPRILTVKTDPASGSAGIVFDLDIASGTTATDLLSIQLRNTSGLAISPYRGVVIKQPLTSWTGSQYNLYVEDTTQASGAKWSALIAGTLGVGKNLLVGADAGAIGGRLNVDNGAANGGAAGTRLLYTVHHASQTADIWRDETSSNVARLLIATNSNTGSSQEALVGIGNAIDPNTDAAQLDVKGPTPASVSGSGVAALTPLLVVGGKGGATSGITGQTGGAGGAITITAGAGGDATGVSGTRTAGSGGNITLAPGDAGVTTGTKGVIGTVKVVGPSSSANVTSTIIDLFSITGAGGLVVHRTEYDGEACYPVTLLVGANAFADGGSTFDCSGTAFIGGAHGSSSATLLAIASGGGTSGNAGVTLNGFQRSNETSARPIFLQSGRLSGVAIGLGGTSFDNTVKNPSLDILGHAFPGTAEIIVNVSGTGSPTTSSTDATYTGLSVSNTATRSDAAHNLTNFGVVASASGGQANIGLRVAAGLLALTQAALTVATGTNVDLNPTTSFVRLTGAGGAFSIDGIAGGSVAAIAPLDGTILILDNHTGQTMTIKHESGTESTAANRIHSSTGADFTANEVVLIYDATDARWEDISAR